MVLSEADNGSAFQKNASDARARFTQHFDPVYLPQTAWGCLWL